MTFWWGDDVILQLDGLAGVASEGECYAIAIQHSAVLAISSRQAPRGSMNYLGALNTHDAVCRVTASAPARSYALWRLQSPAQTALRYFTSSVDS